MTDRKHPHHDDGRRIPSGGRRAWADVGVLIGGQLATQLLNLIALGVAARVLGVDDFGLVQVAVAAAAYALVAAEAGLFTVGVRDLARIRDAAEARSLIRLRGGLLLGLALVAVPVTVPFASLLPGFGVDPAVFLLYLAALIPQAFMLDWAALGLGLTVGAGTARALRAAVQAVLVIALLGAMDGVLGQPARRWLGVFYLVGYLVGNGAVWLAVRRRLGGALRPSWGRGEGRRRALAEALPVGGANLVRRVLYNVDILLLGVLAAPAAAGRYAAAAKLGFVLVVGAEVAMGALLPRLSRAWEEGPGAFRRMLRRQAVALLGVTVVAAVAGGLLGPAVLGIVFGEGFAASAEVLRLLLPAYGLLALGLLFHEAQVAAHRQRGALIPLVVAAVVAVGGGLVLIPGAGALGAARAMLAAHAVYAVGGLLRLRGLKACRDPSLA